MDLDDAYANAAHIAGADDYPPRWLAEADTFRTTMAVMGKARLGLMYGHGTREALDLFLPVAPHKGLAVFIHGGYWRRFDRAHWSHFAQGLLDNSWAVAMPSYDLCPRVRIADITRQVAQAVSVVAREVAGPIRLVGHSAGGHLVARMLAPGMLPAEVSGRIEHAMPISAVTDLRPLLQTEMNADFRLDAAEAEAESPIFQPKPAVPVTVWVGADERPVFLDQSRWLAEAWGSGQVIEDGRHHFDVIDGLLDGDGPMVRALLAE